MMFYLITKNAKLYFRNLYIIKIFAAAEVSQMSQCVPNRQRSEILSKDGDWR